MPLRAALSAPFRFANVVRTVSANVLVRIETDDGLVGWGEACPVPQLTSETQGLVVELIEDHVASLLLNRNPLHRTVLLDELRRGRAGIDFTLDAVDMALIDVGGKASGLPAAELFAAAARVTLPSTDRSAGVRTRTRWQRQRSSKLSSSNG